MLHLNCHRVFASSQLTATVDPVRLGERRHRSDLCLAGLAAVSNIRCSRRPWCDLTVFVPPTHEVNVAKKLSPGVP